MNGFNTRPRNQILCVRTGDMALRQQRARIHPVATPRSE